jgi:hypothetical protein
LNSWLGNGSRTRIRTVRIADWARNAGSSESAVGLTIESTKGATESG